ncbi:MAG TPA: guanylate kinase [Dehalococcoidia bacterium]|nr:guanylate kinase [Dehalococcoidia bacterium]
MPPSDISFRILDRLHKKPPLLIVISGPSGVGKDAVLESLKNRLDISFCHITTATTRKKRPEEIDGVHYVFMSKRQFEAKLKNDEVLEWARVYENYYGVPRESVKKALKSHRIVIIKVDVQGARYIKSKVPHAVYIFLMPASKLELSHRLLRRGNIGEEEFNLRLGKAEDELKAFEAFDYVIENKEDDLQYSVSKIVAIIDAELCKVKHRSIKL